MNLKYLNYLMVAALLMTGGFIAGPVLAQSKPSTSEENLTNAYAEHVYVSTCAQNYRGQFATSKLDAAQTAQLNTHTTDACKCMYGQLSASISPPDVVDYVMYVYGPKPSRDKESAAAMAYNNSQKIKPIGQIVGDKAIRKKCGFIN